MGKLFAVVNERGLHWDRAKSMEEHADWRAHADFMNGLVAEGFVDRKSTRLNSSH